MTIRAFNFGGGVQSTACLVLAAEEQIDFRLFLFANVGDDSENPHTIRYVEEHARPYAAKHGLELRTVQTGRAGGSLRQLVAAPEGKTLALPVLGPKGGRIFRTCTADFKIKPLTRELKRLGATADDPAVSGLGISLDEYQRARTDSGVPWQVLEYPLLDLRIDRAECRRVIERAGLPVPPKSSCYFCPFTKADEWRRMKRNDPGTFAAAVELDRIVQEKGERLLGARAYLNGVGPLDETADQLALFDDGADGCDSGYCFT